MLDKTVIARIKTSPKLLDETLLVVNRHECSKVIIMFSSSYISMMDGALLSLRRNLKLYFFFIIIKAESHFYQQVALMDVSFCILCIGLVRQDSVINCFNYYSNHQKLAH